MPSQIAPKGVDYQEKPQGCVMMYGAALFGLMARKRMMMIAACKVTRNLRSEMKSGEKQIMRLV
jgi:hypothetical protein